VWVSLSIGGKVRVAGDDGTTAFTLSLDQLNEGPTRSSVPLDERSKPAHGRGSRLRCGGCGVRFLRAGSAAAVSLPAPQAGAPTRLQSIDLLRGLDVLLMLFVNEMAGVPGTPSFLLHKAANADAMTLTDTVFPAFLFIIGMAIPLALGGRLRRGQAPALVWRHVLARTVALLVLGVLMINAEHASPDGLLAPEPWNILATLGAVLAWSTFPSDADQATRGRNRRLLGVLILVAAALVYRAEGGSGLFQVRPYWWGILGLIGWAYLVAASLYLLVRDRPTALLGFVALLYSLYLADNAGQAPWLVAVRPLLHVGSVLGSHAAIVVAGMLLTVMLMRHQLEGPTPGGFLRPAILYAAGLFTAGFLLHALHAMHPAFQISKIWATVPWCLFSSAGTTLAWVLVFALADVRGWQGFPRVVAMAGENALLAYLMAPLVLSVFALLAALFHGFNFYDMLSRPTWLGFLRSALFAWAIVRLCGFLRARGLHVQL
jgi:heparan-alpha-glucosaminide N-acetyltransferase